MEYPIESLLLKTIDDMRQNMIETAARTGFISQETVKCSQELDIIINLYMEYCLNNKENCLKVSRIMVQNDDLKTTHL